MIRYRLYGFKLTGSCAAEAALALALGIGSLITFASMVMASQVGETAALRLHATELLLLLGGLAVQRGRQAIGTTLADIGDGEFADHPSSLYIDSHQYTT